MTAPHGLRPGRVARPARLLPGLLGLALLGWGGGAVRAQLRPDFRAAGVLPPSVVQAPSPAVTAPAGPTAAQGGTALPAPPGVPALPDDGFTPDRLTVPALGIDAPVVPVQVEPGGALQIPRDARQVGWWARGGAPGAPVGTAVLAGHVDAYRQGPGALVRLSRAPVGARVQVGGAHTGTTYVVRARRRYQKRDLPWRQLFAQTATPRLVLVTCGGRFDARTGHYDDNVVVVAVPT